MDFSVYENNTTIQTWLGHSNFAFTANTYVHSSKDSHVQMAQAFSKKLPLLESGISFENTITAAPAADTITTII